MYTILDAGTVSKFSDSSRNFSSVVSLVVEKSMYPTRYSSGLSLYSALLIISAIFPFLVMYPLYLKTILDGSYYHGCLHHIFYTEYRDFVPNFLLRCVEF